MYMTLNLTLLIKVRLRARPADDEASKTKRRGRKARHAPSERGLREPQEVPDSKFYKGMKYLWIM